MRIYFQGDVFGRMDSLRLKAAAGQLSADEKKEMEGLCTQVIDSILSGRDEDLLSVSEVDIPAPEKARIYPSLACQECGERFMEILGRTAEGKCSARSALRKAFAENRLGMRQKSRVLFLQLIWASKPLSC